MGKANIQKQLKIIVVGKLKMNSGKTLQEQLSLEVCRLYDCIQRRIDGYYDSYKPDSYRRTFHFKRAMYAEDLVNIRLEGNQIKLSIRFHPSLAYHNTFTSRGNGYVPMLLNYGFNNTKLQNYLGAAEPIEHLTHLEPQLFIENGILDWNKQNKLGITIDVTSIYNGRRFNFF